MACSDCWHRELSPIGRDLGRYAVQLLTRNLRHGTIGSDSSVRQQTGRSSEEVVTASHNVTNSSFQDFELRWEHPSPPAERDPLGYKNGV